MPLINVRIAAQLTGKDRSTITRAIESGKLSATRNAHGRYLIDPAELERVFGALANPDDARTDVHVNAMHEDAPASRIAALEREAELLREMLDRERAVHDRERHTWEEERTFLRELATKHTDQIKLLTDQREKEHHSPSLSIWARLFRKNT